MPAMNGLLVAAVVDQVEALTLHSSVSAVTVLDSTSDSIPRRSKTIGDDLDGAIE